MSISTDPYRKAVTYTLVVRAEHVSKSADRMIQSYLEEVAEDLITQNTEGYLLLGEPDIAVTQPGEENHAYTTPTASIHT